MGPVEDAAPISVPYEVSSGVYVINILEYCLVCCQFFFFFFISFLFLMLQAYCL